MKKPSPRQYTIRNVPDSVDHVLRQRATQSRSSFNTVVLEALAAGAGVRAEPKRDLTGIAGSMSHAEAQRMERELHRQRQVDVDLWQ